MNMYAVRYIIFHVYITPPQQRARVTSSFNAGQATGNTVEGAAHGSGVNAWWDKFTPEDADAMTSGPAPDPAVANKLFDYQALKYRVAEIGVGRMLSYMNDLPLCVGKSAAYRPIGHSTGNEHCLPVNPCCPFDGIAMLFGTR